MLEKLKLLGKTMSIFWPTGKTAKKIGPVSRQNKNNIILILRDGIFLKTIFCIANTKEKSA